MNRKNKILAFLKRINDTHSIVLDALLKGIQENPGNASITLAEIIDVFNLIERHEVVDKNGVYLHYCYLLTNKGKYCLKLLKNK